MLDFRHETFLTLCRLGSFTKTAAHLCITQPAVSQHIRFLEEYYGGKLFVYQGRTLSLTSKGHQLLEYATTAVADSNRLQRILQQEQETHKMLFGATLTIGEYVMPSVLLQLSQEQPALSPHMLVANTTTLTRKLQAGEIDFALVEGFFDKAEFEHRLFSRERFIGICAPSHPTEQCTELSALLNQRLILREQGSGTRDVFEQILREQNLTLQSFRAVWEIGSMSAIKQLVSHEAGISFLYQIAAQKELDAGTIARLPVSNFEITREFNFIFLKNSLHREEYVQWFADFKRHYA